jgi:hypothetical protein
MPSQMRNTNYVCLYSLKVNNHKTYASKKRATNYVCFLFVKSHQSKEICLVKREPLIMYLYNYVSKYERLY